MTELQEVQAWTDGACKGNPGPGGWGVLLRYGPNEKTLCGGEKLTTNNRMELLAAITALESLSRPCRVQLTTDSQYVRQGMLEWLPNWRRRQWRKADGQPVKNADLWQRLDQAAARHEVHWHWIKGHAGHAENERADALANQGIPS